MKDLCIFKTIFLKNKSLQSHFFICIHGITDFSKIKIEFLYYRKILFTIKLNIKHVQYSLNFSSRHLLLDEAVFMLARRIFWNNSAILCQSYFSID